MIYLDYNASTPCDPRVVEAMLPYFSRHYGNPSSQEHAFGRTAASAVETARGHVAQLINAHPQEILFTSGATESNNLAITGVIQANQAGRCKILTTKIEHKSVLEPIMRAAEFGYEVDFMPVDSTGKVDLERAAELITEDTALVSVQAANNEIGTVQDIKALAALAGEKGALFHCDAAQAVGKIDVDVDEWAVDFLSISAHKLYGPKGVGALYVRGGRRRAPLMPLLFGGGQEDGLRAGTLNVPGIVGFGEACRILLQSWREEAQRVSELRDRFEAALAERIPTVVFNGHPVERLPGTTSVTFPGIDAEALIVNTTDLALSTGSACNSGALEPSYVLLAIGLDRTRAYQTFRVGIGRFTTSDEIDAAVEQITAAVERMQRLRST